jgi:CHASE2 domain-containing sensor protein
MAGELFRRDLARHFVQALPVFVVSWLLAGLVGPFLDNPLLVAAVAVPLGVVCWMLWRWLARDLSVLLGGRFLAFLLGYCLLFALLASSDVLTWKRTMVGYEDQVPPNWLGRLVPPALNDWHYWVAPEAPPAPDLVVVTLPSFAGRKKADVRREFAFLVQKASEHGAKGVAFDYYLEEETPPSLELLFSDRLFCSQVKSAAAKGVPVLVGYRHEVRSGLVVERPLASSLATCLPANHQGFLAGYLEPDGLVRMVPLFFKRNEERPSLSLQIARVLAGKEPRRPPGDLVQFVRPQGRVVPFDGSPRGSDLSLFDGSFVVIGTASPNDLYMTPYGELQGAEIHAWAAHALRTGRFIRRLPPAWTFPTLFALCYVLTAVLARRGGWQRLIGWAALLSLAVVTVAALAMRFGLLWIDVSYPLVAIWGLVGLLLVAGGALRRPAALAVPPEPAAGAGFDVFLSHNGKDKPVVRELAAALQARGLRPWIDEDELHPGRPWEPELERMIVEARAVAVLIGKDGLGPWEEVEMRAGLKLEVERHKPETVIPVLLPGAPEKPNLPLLLSLKTWVDLRDGLTERGLDRLTWAITGVKPKARQSYNPQP